MPLDLTGLRPNLNELLLVDQCMIWRDEGGATDDVTDPVTGDVTAVVGQTLVGTFPCKIKMTYRNRDEHTSGQTRVIGFYDVSLPAGTPPMEPGDQIQFVACPHDPNMVGVWFRIDEAVHTTFGLFAKYRVEMRQRQDDRP